jgi:hypothetical protein
MIVHDVQQGSPEWLAVRCGIPTASQFDRILTAKTRKPSSQADKYAHELLTEWQLGEPMDAASSQFMQRGTVLESEAAGWYEFTTDIEPQAVGFVTNDAGTIGCSPDRLIGGDGLLEIKCLSAVNHVAALLGDADEYSLQIGGQLWLTKRDWCDRLYYHTTMKPIVQRVERDEELISQLSEAVEAFADRLAKMKQKLISMGCKPKESER